MRLLSLAFCLTMLSSGYTLARESLAVRLVGSYVTPDWALGVAVDENHAYLAASKSGLRVLSIADPAHPIEVGYFAAPGNQMRSVKVMGDIAYIADCDSSLRIISVADPTNPVEVGRVELPSQALGVDVSGDYAFVADDDSGLRIIHVADPANPIEVGHYTYVRGATDIVVAGNYAYVADDGNGLCIISVADPANPIEVGRHVGTGDALGVAVAEDYAYLAGRNSGLRVDSITDPAHPVEVGYRDSLGTATDVEVAGDLAHVTAWNGNGYSVISVSDPEHPVMVGYYGIGNAGCVALRGAYAYVVGYWGISIMEYYGTGVNDDPRGQSAGVSPGPTFVRGVLLLEGDGRLGTGYRTELLDVNGRVLMSLKPGANDVSRLHSGVYFVREEPQASSHKLHAASKIILVE
jgi:hypothetical protein